MNNRALKGRYRQPDLIPRQVQFTVPTQVRAVEFVCPLTGQVAERRVVAIGEREVYDTHRAAEPYPSHGADRNSVNKRYREGT